MSMEKDFDNITVPDGWKAPYAYGFEGHNPALKAWAEVSTNERPGPDWFLAAEIAKARGVTREHGRVFALSLVEKGVAEMRRVGMRHYFRLITEVQD